MQMHPPTLRARKELFLWPHEAQPFRKENCNLCRRKNSAPFQMIYRVAFQRLRVFRVLPSNGVNVADDIARDVLQGIRIVRRESAAPRTKHLNYSVSRLLNQGARSGKTEPVSRSQCDVQRFQTTSARSEDDVHHFGESGGINAGKMALLFWRKIQ